MKNFNQYFEGNNKDIKDNNIYKLIKCPKNRHYKWDKSYYLMSLSLNLLHEFTRNIGLKK